MKIEMMDISTENNIFKNDESENLSHILYLVNNYQNHQKWQKSACTKTRSEVRGGGAKPYKQKGTGRARRGTNRSPLRVGGGVIFGPKPIKRKMKINKDIIRSAIRLAIQSKYPQVKIIQSNGIDFKSAKTLIQSYQDKKILVLASIENESLIKAFRNFENCLLASAKNVRVVQILKSDLILIDETEKGILEERAI